MLVSCSTATKCCRGPSRGALCVCRICLRLAAGATRGRLPGRAAMRRARRWRGGRVAIANDRAASLLADRAEDMLRQLDAVGRRLQFFDLAMMVIRLDSDLRRLPLALSEIAGCSNLAERSRNLAPRGSFGPRPDRFADIREFAFRCRYAVGCLVMRAPLFTPKPFPPRSCPLGSAPLPFEGCGVGPVDPPPATAAGGEPNVSAVDGMEPMYCEKARQ